MYHREWRKKLNVQNAGAAGFIKRGLLLLKTNAIFVKNVNSNSQANRNIIRKKLGNLLSEFTTLELVVTESAKFLICTIQTQCDGLKKTDAVWISPETDFRAFEMDEVFWYILCRKGYENGVNTYIMTMISRTPRQIVAFSVDKSVNSKSLQQMVNSVPPAKYYFVDGCPVYQDVDFLGRLKQNFENKKDTHNIESTNSDLRHYIPTLKRKSRCFPRKKENLTTVLSVFADAYNKYNHAKIKYDRTPPFSFLNFL